MLAAFSITPLGTGDSVSASVSDAVRLVRESGLPNETNAMFTNVEGEWDEVMALVKTCVLKVAESNDCETSDQQGSLVGVDDGEVQKRFEQSGQRAARGSGDQVRPADGQFAHPPMEPRRNAGIAVQSIVARALEEGGRRGGTER